MPDTVLGLRRDDNQQTLPNGLLPRTLSPSSVLSDSNYSPDSFAMSGKEDVSEHDVENAENNQDKPRLTIRQLREAAQKEALAKELAKRSQTPGDIQTRGAAAPKKKKPSIFGGLFQVREPTQIALNQVAAQMIAQHGSTSATKVPNVRLEKMPEFVPKVNSKWDGIPESVKQKEKKEKENSKQKARRDSFFATDSKPGNSRNSSSTTASSFGGYGNSSGSQGTSSRSRFYAQSVNSSGDLASQQRTDPSIFSRTSTSHSTAASTTDDCASSPRWPSSSAVEAQFTYGNGLDPALPKTTATNRAFDLQPLPKKSYETTDSSRLPKSSTINRPPISPTAAAERGYSWESIDWAQAARSYIAPSARVVPLLSPSAICSAQGPSATLPSELETPS